jgi:hypothetical protein
MCRPASWRVQSPRSGEGASLALALFLILGAALLWAPSAEAQVQTSGSILLAPDCCQVSPGNVGQPGETIHINVFIQSTSQAGSPTFVDATVTGTTTINLGCSSSNTPNNCVLTPGATELAALTFASCAPAAGVTDCVQDGGNPNHVLIHFPDVAPFFSASANPGGTLAATITAHFTPLQNVIIGSMANGHAASDGQFFFLGATGDGDLHAATNGSAAGSAPLFYPGGCGDGLVNTAAGETCDPNDPLGAPPGCRTTGPDACTFCGDGVLQTNSGETCDGTTGTPGSGCRTDCTSCGDGILQSSHGETCDGTAGTPGTGCRSDCTSCGDGVLQTAHGETCDGTAGTPGTGCRTTGANACTSCGDSVLQASAGETCDPPGSAAGGNGNTCRSDCTVCGDGVVQAADGETCDEGSPTATCNNACAVPQVAEVCRTPGFWQEHACEASGSLDCPNKGRGHGPKPHNITQLALNQAMDKIGGGPLTICGELVDNTKVPDQASALEALCVKPSTDLNLPLQVARQLMSLALNCAATSDQAVVEICDGTSFEDVFHACNEACATAGGHVVTADVNGHIIDCGDTVDCLNNGGIFDPATGQCGGSSGCHDETATEVGACTVSGEFCSSNLECPPGAGECKPGPAGSPGACNAARANNCTIFGGC